MTSSADLNCDVAQPHTKATSTGNVIQQGNNELESAENNGELTDQGIGRIYLLVDYTVDFVIIWTRKLLKNLKTPFFFKIFKIPSNRQLA